MIAKFRIVERNGKFHIQKRFFLFWTDVKLNLVYHSKDFIFSEKKGAEKVYRTYRAYLLGKDPIYIKRYKKKGLDIKTYYLFESNTLIPYYVIKQKDNSFLSKEELFKEADKLIKKG